jgi:hypothetical protein
MGEFEKYIGQHVRMTPIDIFGHRISLGLLKAGSISIPNALTEMQHP